MTHGRPPAFSLPIARSPAILCAALFDPSPRLAMNSHPPLGLALVLLAACQSAPRFSPLPVHDVFPVTYEGRVAPLAAGDEDVFAVEPVPATAEPGRAVSFRATIVELSPDAASALLPGLVGGGGPPQGAHVDAVELHQALRQLTAAGTVRSAPIVLVKLGGKGITTACTKLAYVKGLDLAPVSPDMIVDPEIDDFLYGSQLCFAPAGTDSGLGVAVDWHFSDPVLPIPQARARRCTLQLPVLARHHLHADLQLATKGAFVFGALPGNDQDVVRLLFVEVDGGEVVAAR